jgi:N-dimethylarginine dimethylaminohydrolase
MLNKIVIMSSLELSKIYLHLEHEISHLSQSTILLYRSALKEDAQKVISDFKNDIDNWVLKLNERYISCYDLENLLESKRESIRLPNLESKRLKSEDLEIFKSDILRVIAKSILSTYLDTLFRNTSLAGAQSFNKGSWF